MLLFVIDEAPSRKGISKNCELCNEIENGCDRDSCETIFWEVFESARRVLSGWRREKRLIRIFFGDFCCDEKKKF